MGVYVIANLVKHRGVYVSRDAHQETDAAPMWLTNDGFKTTAEPRYSELTTLLSEIAAVADKMHDPTAFSVEI